MVTRTELTKRVVDLENRIAAHEKATVRISVKSVADLGKRIAALEKAIASQTPPEKETPAKTGKE